MKKLWIILFAVLVLSGCANEEPVETTTEAVTTTAETTPPGYYVPRSSVEKNSDGAVRMYQLPDDQYQSVSAIGDQILLTASEGKPVLTVLTGAECVPTANMTIPVEGTALYNGYAYFLAKDKQVVFLDAQLNETFRLDLPKDMQGQPLVSTSGEEVFYCVGNEIFAYDVERKISRLLKTHEYEAQTLTGSYFEGDLILCEIGDKGKIYVSAETGQTLYAKNDLADLFTYENTYLALRTDGTVLQKIVGTQDGQYKQWNIEDANVTGALSLGGTLGWSVDEKENLLLNFYDNTTGLRTASIVVSGFDVPVSVYADRWSNSIWLLCDKGQTLLRWQPKLSPVTDETVYLNDVYTAEVPDEEGLKECEERAKSFQKSNGVLVYVWEDAVKHPGEHTLEAEYQPEAIHRMMNDLLPVLREFPSKFLKKSNSKKLRICLVRSIDGEQKAVQYWVGKYAYIVLTEGIDLRSEFMRCLGYVVDSHVLGNSPDYDYWYTTNPDGFTYGAENQKTEYLEDGNRYFTSENAMTSPVEDRSEIFYQAMLPDNQNMFASEHMQKKLTMLCKAIRDAWNTKKEEDTFPWEQYLKESVAYKKK